MFHLELTPIFLKVIDKRMLDSSSPKKWTVFDSGSDFIIVEGEKSWAVRNHLDLKSQVFLWQRKCVIPREVRYDWDAQYDQLYSHTSINKIVLKTMSSFNFLALTVR